jgi:hypothetical protein
MIVALASRCTATARIKVAVVAQPKGFGPWRTTHHDPTIFADHRIGLASRHPGSDKLPPISHARRKLIHDLGQVGIQSPLPDSIAPYNSDADRQSQLTDLDPICSVHDSRGKISRMSGPREPRHLFAGADTRLKRGPSNSSLQTAQR